MQFLERLLGFSLLLAGALMTSGCSDRAQMPLVSGSVTLDGAPIAEGKIRFEPTDGRGPTAEAMIVDGKYEVRIPLGKEKVLIEAYKPGNPPARPDTYPGLQAGLP